MCVVSHGRRSMHFIEGHVKPKDQTRRRVMTNFVRAVLVALLLAFVSSVAWASEDGETIKLFKNAGQSNKYFGSSYGYAVFPTIGKGGLVIGGAHGDGRVYAKGKYIGDTSMTQLSFGLQAGGEAYSEIIFFHDKRALDEFTSGNYEFGAGVNAVAVTAAASATTGTTGSGAGASGGEKDAATAGSYHNGVAVFTIAKGGLMAEASVSGQKFKYKAAK
jgi:lipid-binding SYLF domain-containing protein